MASLPRPRFNPQSQKPSHTPRGAAKIHTYIDKIKHTSILQYSCLENRMNSMKRQKDRTLKDELPRLVGAQYATGDQRRNNSRKNEETEPKQKQHPVVDVTGDGSKVQWCKEQYA